MSQSTGSSEAIPATPWQRVSITLACFIGIYAAWAAFEFLGVAWMPTYEKTTEHYKARIEANREAITNLRDAQATLPGSKLNSLQLFEKEFELIGEEYSRELASLPRKQGDAAGTVLIVSLFAGGLAGALTSLLGWVLEGLGACMRGKSKRQVTALRVGSNVKILPNHDRVIER